MWSNYTFDQPAGTTRVVTPEIPPPASHITRYQSRIVSAVSPPEPSLVASERPEINSHTEPRANVTSNKSATQVLRATLRGSKSRLQRQVSLLARIFNLKKKPTRHMAYTPPLPDPESLFQRSRYRYWPPRRPSPCPVIQGDAYAPSETASETAERTRANEIRGKVLVMALKLLRGMLWVMALVLVLVFFGFSVAKAAGMS